MKRRLTLLWLTLLLIFPGYPVQANTPVFEQVSTEPIILRVLLASLDITNRLDLRLNDDFYGSSGQFSYLMKRDTEWNLMAEENCLYIYGDDIHLKLETPVHLKRQSSSEESGFTVIGNNGLYHGDLTLVIKDGQLLPILEIELETYLLGVLPHEMSNSFPLEALKAQAVAARTYAIRNMNSKRDYDVTDTTSHQVFRIATGDISRCKQAIAETGGLCGYYKNQPAQCFYCTSNGGYTEPVNAVWQTDEDFSYYRSDSDAYDFDNPESPVRNYTLQKKYVFSTPNELNQLVAEHLQDWLKQNDYLTGAESIKVTQVTDCKLSDPDKLSPAVYTVLNLTVQISARKLQKSTDESMVSMTIEGPQTPLPEPITVKIPVSSAEAAFGLDINRGSSNEIWSVKETDSTFVISARRCGHGVGMSQRGAEWMAKTYQKTYLEILSFYYPGMTIKQLVYQSTETGSDETEQKLQQTPGPAATPTPRPTAVPLSITPKPGEKRAKVTEIDDLSSLNLRAEPRLSSEIITRLYKNQELIIESFCEEEGWAKVYTDTLNGYVKTEFLTIEP